jgi:hypothetical protein
MASKVLSGASNPSYTNDTGQNVRIVINYLDNPTSVTWEDITPSATFTATSTDTSPVYDSRCINGWYTRTAAADSNPFSNSIRQLVIKVNGSIIINTTTPSSVIVGNQYALINGVKYYPKTYRGSQYGWPVNGTSKGPATSPGGDDNNAFDISFGAETFAPKEIMLNPGKSFSATCGAYNIVIIKEDGT